MDEKNHTRSFQIYSRDLVLRIQRLKHPHTALLCLYTIISINLNIVLIYLFVMSIYILK